MTIQKTAPRRLVAALGALTMGVAGAFAMGTSAFADDPPVTNSTVGPDQPGAPTEGSLTINKYKGAEVPRGESIPADREKLDGVEFTVTQVGRESACDPIDLADAADWDGLRELFESAPAAPSGDFCLTDVVQKKATADGKTVFDLDVGVYFVEETDPGEHNIVSPVPSFYVSIPTSLGKAGQGWNYDVVVDPKNQIMDAPSKTIEADQTDLVVGDNVVWELEIPIPTLNNDERFESAVITDRLDGRLGYVGSTVYLDGEVLTGDRYTAAVEADNVVKWVFTDGGRGLLDGHMGGKITIELVTTVESVGDGSIPNKDYESQFNGTTVPGEEVPYTYWGQLSIKKTDDSTPAKPLEGAEFQVFPAVDAVCEAEAPKSGSIATGTSDDQGVVIWQQDVTPTNVLGLWIANSDTPQPSPAKDYCVYETVVPAGHSANQKGQLVTIKVPGKDLKPIHLSVVNSKTEGPGLPVTGGAGTVGLMTSGILLLGAGAAVMVMARRRRITA